MINVVAGQTAPIYHYLKIDGATPTNADGSPLSMAGMQVVLVVHDQTGVAKAIAGVATIEDPDAWLVKFSPDAADFVEGRWRARYKVTDGTGKIGYFPSGSWEDLIVRAA